MMKPGTVGTIRGGAFDGFRSVVLEDRDSRLYVEVEIFGRRTAMEVEAGAFRSEQEEVDDPLAMIRADLEEMVRRRGHEQRKLAWWAQRRVEGEPDGDAALAALLERFAAFARTVDGEIDDEVEKELEALRAELVGVEPAGIAAWWRKEREARTKWRAAAWRVTEEIEGQLLVPDPGAPAEPEARAEAVRRLFTEGGALRARAVEAARRIDRARVVDPATSLPRARNRELEAAIEADPAAVDRWMVYADWLQARNDPRGELIAVQAQERSARADRRARELLAEHRDYFLGALAPFVPPVRLGWRLGFVRAATVVPGREDEREGVDVAVALRALLPLHSARFLEELSVGAISAYEDGLERRVREALVEAGPRPLLRTFRVTSLLDEEMLSWTASPMLDPVLQLYPGLRTLEIQAGEVSLESVHLPALETLRIETCGLRAATLRAITAARWPRLKRLELWFGDPERGGDAGLQALAPLLQGDAFPALEELGIVNAAFTDDLAQVLPDAPVLPRLRVLDLSRGTLSDAGVRALAARPERFRHLERLDLSESFLTDEGTTTAERLAARVVTDDQREAEEYEGRARRYVSVWE